MCLQNALEARDGLAGARVEPRFLHVVERNHVHMRAHAGELFCKKLRLLGAVAHTGDHCVLKGHPPPGDLVILLARSQHRFDVPTAVYRHDLIARLVVRRVKRNGKRQLELLFGKQLDLIDKAACRKADVPHADVHPVRAVDKLQKAHDRIKVIQRLADAHEHDIGNRKSGIDLTEQHLIEKLRGSEPSHKAAQRRRAEFAAHQAADLRRDADRISVVILHDDGLDAVAI